MMRPMRLTRPRFVALVHPLALSVALAACGVAVLATSPGCAERTVRVEMKTTPEGGVQRSFASNTLERSDEERLQGVYQSGPQDDAATGGKRFEGRFDEGLPSEVGNQSGLTSIVTELGTTWFYFEAFDGVMTAEARRGDNGAMASIEASGAAVGAGSGAASGTGSTVAGPRAAAERSDWAGLQQRMAAGELWIRLFGRWAEKQVVDPSKREEFRIYIDETLVPFALNLMLRYGAMQAVAQSARVGVNYRESDEEGPRSADETFWQSVFMPLLLMLATEGGADLADEAVRRGIFTADEMHRLFLLSLDGNAGGRTRTWSRDEIFVPAITRQVRRFKPDAKPFTQGQVTLQGLGFLLWATTSPERDDLLLASSAISDVDKERLRNGDRSVELPPPFGVDPMREPENVKTEVRLDVAEQPFATNGVWDDEANVVVFKARFYDAFNRTILYEPIFYAAWSVADESAQRAIFGEVLLRGEGLAEFALWREILDRRERVELAEALRVLREERRPGPLAALVAESRERRKAPQALREWIAERVK